MVLHLRLSWICEQDYSSHVHDVAWNRESCRQLVPAPVKQAQEHENADKAVDQAIQRRGRGSI